MAIHVLRHQVAVLAHHGSQSTASSTASRWPSGKVHVQPGGVPTTAGGQEQDGKSGSGTVGCVSSAAWFVGPKVVVHESCAITIGIRNPPPSDLPGLHGGQGLHLVGDERMVPFWAASYSIQQDLPNPAGPTAFNAERKRMAFTAQASWSGSVVVLLLFHAPEIGRSSPSSLVYPPRASQPEVSAGTVSGSSVTVGPGGWACLHGWSGLPQAPRNKAINGDIKRCMSQNRKPRRLLPSAMRFLDPAPRPMPRPIPPTNRNTSAPWRPRPIPVWIMPQMLSGHLQGDS